MSKSGYLLKHDRYLNFVVLEDRDGEGAAIVVDSDNETHTLLDLCLSQFQLGTSPPREKFFDRANPRHPGKFFCLIPCPGAKNDGRIPGGGAKFSKLEETSP